MSVKPNRYRVTDHQIEQDLAWCESAWKPRTVGSKVVQVIDVGAGEPLVFIPVFTGSEFMYGPLIRHLSRRFRTLLYRRRESITAPISLADRVEELRDLLDAHQLRSVHLSAHSDGAMVAIAFAAQYPDRVRSLSLYCVADVYRIPPQPFMQAYLKLMERYPLDKLVPDSVLKRLLAYYGSSDSGFTWKQIGAQTSKITSFAKFFKYSMLPLLLDYDGQKLAPRVTCPVTLIHHGSKDRILRMEQMEALAERFPNCGELQVIPGGGHMFPYCAPEEVLPLLDGFYDGYYRVRDAVPAIVTLSDPHIWDYEHVGRKAANLAHLAKQQLPVPPAFCITAAALAGEWSASFEQQLRFHYDQLLSQTSGAAVAVRSSSALEDMGEASFAGQYETVLNVTGWEQLLEAVRHCLASYWTDRAVAYRKRAQVENGQVHMGILVQTMVQPVASGILFTRDPRAASHVRHMVVNAVWGLGEAGVSGTITPDEYTLDSASHRVVAASIAEKSFKLVSVFGGGVAEQQLLPDEAKAPVLQPMQLAQLAKIGQQLEGYWSCPQDIEWAYDGKQILLLQARPITTMQNKWSYDHRIDGYHIRWGAVMEWGKTPISSMTASILQGISFNKGLDPIGVYLSPQLYRLYDGYLYSPVRVKRTWRWINTPFRLWKSYRQLHQSFGQQVDAYLAKLKPMQVLDLRKCSTEQLVHAIRSLSRTVGDAFATIVIPYLGICMVSELLLARYYRWLANGREPAGHIGLLQGFMNKSLEADYAYWQLATTITQSESLMEILEHSDEPIERLGTTPEGQKFLASLTQVLQEHGHRLQDLDITCATAKDDPAGVVQLLRTLAKASTSNPIAEIAKRAEEREQLLNHMRLVARNHPIKGRWFETAYQLAAKYTVIRENRPFYLGLGWQRLRELLIELGERCKREGRLREAEHIFSVTLEELSTAVASSALSDIAQSRSEQWNLRRTMAIADEINPPGWRRYAAAAAARARQRSVSANTHHADLVGTPGSPGITTGKVRIVKELADFSAVHAGDVIVTTSTTPAWTVLFGVASAIITDVGGALSHAAIVAREYRIPAVLGTGNATSVLKNGQQVRIDGSTGHIFVLAEERAL
ncbi:alpha/beta fold hydrolase [Paenibacillus sp. MMS18-CY102]|uniref:alpha/beta fold hydrolase n=1 Tax=Paenibacillus sp. MMS18-CY102 TaxID=2682849 RepID=UPI0013666B25|nr:alpha/beta fold hydrolase [Paenibacillus sp. MMS18-CY102]